tara:strand:+ start:139 stop:741 length:603 start_codon:yes stop_codon:yes gene_type:complete
MSPKPLLLALTVLSTASLQAEDAKPAAGHEGHQHADIPGLKTELIQGITDADFMKLGDEPKTVKITLVATYTADNYGMNFNGYSHGKAVYTVPVGWKVDVHFINPSPVPHSAIVAERSDTKKLQIPEPYFEGGATEKHLQGIAVGTGDFSFTPDEEGEFALACGFPAHAVAGHWVALEVVAEDQKPSLQLGEDGEVKVLE